ncbi:methyl-accepting chemotaxis protein [Thaumasiovibrio subtropicus]|uniref:methyl-accepting chemotaxis protein n=1 Tax=Thaumasiovibrio subtropicus TaxID=1891207 RepID=UPI000B364210|nr:methyl-accepting chemotaxis protein [Thaumasiovibrio subtropicus]
MFFQRFGTIKLQLLIINVLVIVSLFIFAFSEWRTLQRLSELKHLSSQAAETNVDILLLRRYEKDFLARSDTKYIQDFTARADRLQTRLSDIHTAIAHFDASVQPRIITLKEHAQSYVDTFIALTEIAINNGLSAREGLRGKLFESSNAAEEAFLILSDDNLYNGFLTLRRNEKDFLLERNTQHATYFGNNVDNLKALIDNSGVASSEKTALKRLVDGYHTDLMALIAGIEMIGLSYETGKLGEMRSLIHQVEKDINDVETLLLATSEALQANETRTLFIAIIVLSLVIISIFVAFGQQLTSRLKEVNTMMRDIADGDGDLTSRMTVNGSDELAQLSTSINTFIGRLQHIIQQIGGISEQLHTAAEGSFHATEASRENAQQQQHDSTDAATAVSEMLVTNMSINDHTQQAAESAHIVRTEAQQSLETLNQAGKDISELATYLHSSQETIKQLESQSEAISAVVAVIQDIAEQTNLLALNAAIEAARAGESGRGFAVVADEVRKLATRTHDSTQEIETTIKGLTVGVQDSVSTILNGKDQADRSAEKANLAIASMQTIVSTIESLVEMNNAIAQGSGEHAQSTDDINQRIMHISDLAMSTMDVIQHASERSEEVEAMSKQLQGLVSQFKY